MPPWSSFPDEFFHRDLVTVGWDFPNGISIWLKPLGGQRTATYLSIGHQNVPIRTPNLEALKELLWWVAFEHPSSGTEQIVDDWYRRKAY